MKDLHIDIESFSDIDLNKCGVYRYAESPDFEILLFGYAVDDGPVTVIDLARGEKIPEEILDALTDDSVTKWAFNAGFERVCLSRYLRDLGRSLDPFHDGHPLSTECARYLNPAGWRCSMVWAAAMGLPLSLKDVGGILKLEEQKMDEGKALIKYFSVPCAPTKANGGRTRNLPSDDPEKWETFKAYNKRDVEVEMAIQEKLSGFPVPEAVWDEYHIDQEINDRGVRVDMRLVDNAIAMDGRSRRELTAAMKKLTALDNPNSVQQMKQWLADHGLETDTLGKKAVAALLKEAPPELAEVLSLRQQLAKSSVKKYQAMENCVCPDGRCHGMFQFYGANRTGRWSGRLVQLQNLPQNHLPDLAQARALVRAGDFDSVKLLYEDVPDTLSQLIRTAFIPKENYKFYVADFSAIEARVIAWYAGEKWRQDVFEKGGDIYCASASQMFHVPVEKHGVNGHLRQKGKQAELACIAEGQLVLTDKGLVPIESVTMDHKLWDGENWVTHDGIIYKGEREVIEYDGLTATPDHLVWVEGQPQPIPFGVAAACGIHLLQTGNGRQAIRLGENHIFGEKMEQEYEPLLRPDKMHGLRKHTVAATGQLAKRKIQRLSRMFTAQKNSFVARPQTDSSKAEVRKSERCGLSQLWCPWHKIFISKRDSGWTVSDRNLRSSRQENGNRSIRQRLRLCSRKSSVCVPCRKQQEQAMHGSQSFFPGILALCKERGNSETFNGTDKRRDNPGCRRCSFLQAEKLETHKCKARLYDIRNAGEHHRFTVSGKLVHNCGYGGSVGALKAMGALEMGLSEDELQPLVSAWRQTNPHIVKFWWDVDRAVTDAVKYKRTSRSYGLVFSYKSGMLFITLPSGRNLVYVKPKIGTNRFGGECVTYEGVGATKKWERIDSYGPKFVENIVQATSRDILCNSMKTLRCCSIVMHIHDELVIEATPDVSLDVICRQMGRTPDWAPGLNLRADGYICDFYQKD